MAFLFDLVLAGAFFHWLWTNHPFITILAGLVFFFVLLVKLEPLWRPVLAALLSMLPEKYGGDRDSLKNHTRINIQLFEALMGGAVPEAAEALRRGANPDVVVYMSGNEETIRNYATRTGRLADLQDAERLAGKSTTR